MSWTNLEDDKPRVCVDLLISDGKGVWYGWLESYIPCEELSFAGYVDGRFQTMEDIEWWMYFPAAPEEERQ